MSGGSYDYVSGRITDAADTLARRHPKQPHVLGLAALLVQIADVMHRIEWADSGDTSWTPELDEAIRAVVHPGAELAAVLVHAETAQRNLTAAIQRAEEMAA